MWGGDGNMLLKLMNQVSGVLDRDCNEELEDVLSDGGNTDNFENEAARVGGNQYVTVTEHVLNEAVNNGTEAVFDGTRDKVTDMSDGGNSDCFENEAIRIDLTVANGKFKIAAEMDGICNSSTSASLIPAELVGYVKSLAVIQHSEFDELELSKARAELLAFYRWKGKDHLPVFEMFWGLSEDGGCSQKNNPVLGGDERCVKKKRSMSELSGGLGNKRSCKMTGRSNTELPAGHVRAGSGKKSGDSLSTKQMLLRLSMIAKCPERVYWQEVPLVRFLTEFRNYVRFGILEPGLNLGNGADILDLAVAGPSGLVENRF